MKLYTPESSELLEVTSITTHENGILIQGRIMETMPMKAILRPQELRAGFKFLSIRLFFKLIAMLFKRN